jgi:hypothetical protein
VTEDRKIDVPPSVDACADKLLAALDAAGIKPGSELCVVMAHFAACGFRNGAVTREEFLEFMRECWAEADRQWSAAEAERPVSG